MYDLLSSRNMKFKEYIKFSTNIFINNLSSILILGVLVYGLYTILDHFIISEILEKVDIPDIIASIIPELAGGNRQFLLCHILKVQLTI